MRIAKKRRLGITSKTALFCCGSERTLHGETAAEEIGVRPNTCLLENSTHISAVCPVDIPDAQLQAYKKIIDLADVMLAVYDGDTPATGNAEDRVLAYAESLEKPLVLLHPTELTTMRIGWPFRTG